MWGYNWIYGNDVRKAFNQICIRSSLLKNMWKTKKMKQYSRPPKINLVRRAGQHEYYVSMHILFENLLFCSRTFARKIESKLRQNRKPCTRIVDFMSLRILVLTLGQGQNGLIVWMEIIFSLRLQILKEN